MAFPDVDPFSIALPSFSPIGRYHHANYPSPGRAIYELGDSYNHPHLWYSTSELIRALELFIASGDQLSETSTYRFHIFRFRSMKHDIEFYVLCLCNLKSFL